MRRLRLPYLARKASGRTCQGGLTWRLCPRDKALPSCCSSVDIKLFPSGAPFLRPKVGGLGGQPNRAAVRF